MTTCTRCKRGDRRQRYVFFALLACTAVSVAVCFFDLIARWSYGVPVSPNVRWFEWWFVVNCFATILFYAACWFFRPNAKKENNDER